MYFDLVEFGVMFLCWVVFDYVEVVEQFEVGEVEFVGVFDQCCLFVWLFQWCGGEVEVFVGVVGVDVECVVVFIDVVFDVFFVCVDQNWCGQWIGGGDQVNFVGFVVGIVDDQLLFVG